MRVRALTGAAIFAFGCTPSADLASYSEGSSESPERPGLQGSSGSQQPGSGQQPESGDGMGAGGGSSGSGEAELPEMFEPGLPEPDPGGTPPVTTVDEEPVGNGEETPDEVDSEPEPERFRFVRLVADSAVQGPFTSVAEFNVLDGAGDPIDRSAWIAEADSEELVWVGGAPAALALDGAPASMWHTAWFEVQPPPPHPHVLEIDMGQLHAISGFRYLSRQDGSLDGRISDYRLFVSVDGVDWGQAVAAGTLQNSDAEQEILLDP